MMQFALSFLLISLTMSAVILAISMFNKLFGRAFPAKLRYAVWLVALVGIVVPLRPVIGDAVFTVPLPAPIQAQYEVPEIAGAEILLATPGMTEAVTEYSSITGWAVSPFMVCLFVWGIIAITIFTYHIRQYIYFLRMIRRWGIPLKDEDTLSIFRAVQTEMGLDGKRIDIKVCSFVSSSMLTGFRRPIILLPEKHFEADELELIFKHELIHYKRRDLYVKLLSVIAISVHWYNPVIYMMNSAMQADGEASCDEAVLLSADKEDRRFYAEVVVGMIGKKNTAGPVLSTCFYGGKSSIKKRLESIVDTSRKIKTKWSAALILAGVMGMTMLSGSILAFAFQEASEIINARITTERAKEIALTTVGGGSISDCRYDGGSGVYRVVVLHGDKRYRMDIEAGEGLVTNYRLEAIEITVSDASSNTQSPARPNGELTMDQAIEAALSIVGGGIVDKITFERNKGVLVYRIGGRYERRRYDMRINAATGEVVRFNEGETRTVATGYSAQISFGEAMEIAVKRIGGGEILEIEFEPGRGGWIYEIKLRHNGRKHEVYINADTGDIIKFK